MKRPVRPGRRGPWQAETARLEGALFTAVALLAGLGLVVIHSATGPFAPRDALAAPHFWRHAGAVAVGMGLAWTLARLPLAAWRRVALPLWAAAVTLLLVTLVSGVEINGARRWLELPGLGLRFQPAEIAKLATVLATAHLLALRRGRAPRSPGALAPAALVALVPAALLIAQPDLGNAVLLLLLASGLLFVAGVPLRVFALPSALGLAGLAAFVTTHRYAWNRLTGFLDPWGRPDAEGFQLVQSFVAFGRGGLLGVGLGDGRQKLFYLPEAHTDFVLAVVAEELGLVGVLGVLGGFAALLLVGMHIARRAREPFSLLIGFGATALLTVPAALNAAVVTGLLPTKGLPLPFLSYGRTALLVGFVGVGLLLAVVRRGGGPPGWGRR